MVDFGGTASVERGRFGAPIGRGSDYTVAITAGSGCKYFRDRARAMRRRKLKKRSYLRRARGCAASYTADNRLKSRLV
jgi:hypothetical protein